MSDDPITVRSGATPAVTPAMLPPGWNPATTDAERDQTWPADGASSARGTAGVRWEPSHTGVRQVGPLGDEPGRITFAAWERSRAPIFGEGERTRFRNVARNRYRGRVPVTLTGWRRVVFPDRK